MPSLVTGIIGGIQGASAAHNAAAAQRQGYSQAATSVNNAVTNANPILSAAAGTAGTGVTNAASTAGSGVTGAATAAGTGATAAAGQANGLLQPYIDNGTAASNKYTNLTQAGFNFNPSDLQNTPGYQFALSQGLRGVNSSGAASGLLNSGANLKAAAGYAQGLASTTYQQQYQNALNSYQTNVNSLVPGMQQGLTASGQAGANLQNAAQYTGNTGLAGAEYAGNAGINAAQYAGNAGMWAGGQQASNLVNAGVYQGNTQIGTGNATAQGDIGAANSWNGMLGAIGNAGNTALTAGFAPGGGGWSFGNMATNFGNMFGAGNYGGGGGSGAVSGNGTYMPPNVFGGGA